jgi:glycosyltransferase involved in cell wall biosynthesis
VQPLVSILIPAYNAEAFIADTLRSALSQSWSNREIIVVDDGSKDQTLNVARQFIARGVKVVTHANQGAAATRNHAYALSSGQYIQWLDADDLLSPQKIERQMAAAGRFGPEVLLSSGWAYFICRPATAQFRPTPLWQDLDPAEWLLRKLGQNLHMQTATWLVSRELSEAAGQWNTDMLSDDDGEYFCRVLMRSKGVRFVSNARVYYRNAGYGRLSYIGTSRRKVEAQFASMKFHIAQLRSIEDSPRSRAAAVQYLQNWSINFYPEHNDVFEAAKALAGELGGSLKLPKLSWKYDWIRKTIGWNAARRARLVAPRLRWTVTHWVDRQLSRFQGNSVPAESADMDEGTVSPSCS